jgi:hypothetical protein
MCCCEKPTINGTTPVKMTFDAPGGNYQPNPPELAEGDQLLFDEPGRCGGRNPDAKPGELGAGGLDCHSHHYRLVRHYGLDLDLLVRHGGGDKRVRLRSTWAFEQSLNSLDSNGRYWMFNAIYHAQNDAASHARETERMDWKTAAAEKRIKTRKYPARGVVKVWIEPAGALSK